MRDLVIYGSKAEEITIRRLLIKFLSEISERRHVRKIQDEQSVVGFPMS